MRDIGTLGGAISAAYGINDHGQVVGESLIATGENRAFLYEAGTDTIVDLNALLPDGSPWIVSSARGINDLGQIAASGFNGTETRYTDRKTEQFRTFLTGDLSGDDKPDFAFREDNSFHVVTGSGVDNTSLMHHPKMVGYLINVA